MTMAATVLALNGGSSSIRFAVYRCGSTLTRSLHGKLDRIGQPSPLLTVQDADGVRTDIACPTATDPRAAATVLLAWLEDRQPLARLAGVGHRLVHGLDHAGPALVTPALLAELQAHADIDPDHLPGAWALIDAVRQHAPALPQVACFDTSFHRSMPRVATLMAVPRRLAARGVRRYGFHGLSYAYLTDELERVAGRSAAQGRLILAHLGSGASLAAVHHGRSIDTTMGFTPASGLPMGTRSGDVDPGLAAFMARTEGLTPSAYDSMLNHASGLLGVSETSADMRDLLQREAGDPRAADAVALFCYQARKAVGAFAAALGGVDTLVFSGGIGEQAAPVRERICDGLGFLGIVLDPARNRCNSPIISGEDSAVTVRIIPTDEECMIARAVQPVIGAG